MWSVHFIVDMKNNRMQFWPRYSGKITNIQFCRTNLKNNSFKNIDWGPSKFNLSENVSITGSSNRKCRLVPQIFLTESSGSQHQYLCASLINARKILCQHDSQLAKSSVLPIMTRDSAFHASHADATDQETANSPRKMCFIKKHVNNFRLAGCSLEPWSLCLQVKLSLLNISENQTLGIWAASN